MITNQSLYELAKCRYEEAKILISQNKPDGAVYLCGYALELMLKRHIVKILNWDGYPENKNEFQGYSSFKTHELEILLSLSGLEKKIKGDNKIFADWQIAISWNSEIRYRKIGALSNIEAQGIIKATQNILNFILQN